MSFSSLLVIGFRLRHDIGAGFCLAVALYIYSLAIRQNQSKLHFLAGLVAALGMFAHYHAAGFTIALGVGLYMPGLISDLKQRMYRLPTSAILFAVGAFAGALLVITVQMLPNLEQVRLYTTPRALQTINEFFESFSYHITQVAQLSQYEFLLFILAFIVALVRREAMDLSLAVSLGLSYVVLGLMASWRYGPFDYYSVPLIPLMALLTGRLWIIGYKQNGNHKNVVTILACVCFLTVQLGVAAKNSLGNLPSNLSVHKVPNEAVQWMLDNIPPTQKVLADNYYFLWLYKYPFLSPYTPEYIPSIRRIPDRLVSNATRTETLIEIWESLSPDVIIIDPNLATSGYLVELDKINYPQEHGYKEVFVANAPGQQPITVYWRQ